ncbi:MAG: 4Fe-4S binding protein [Planctomycetota bacterium]|nr:4Fe-4S binding protein [Planctomycetota bacterium]
MAEQNAMTSTAAALSRRELLRLFGRGLALIGLGGLAGSLARRTISRATVWQIDPRRCIQCGRCATECVLTPSAVKCVHAFDICGYCDLCFGYYRHGTTEFGTGAEKEQCPTAALRRRFIEPPYYEYQVDESRCIGCSRCVKGCQTFGNGSLYLQVRHDRCQHCNECRIAIACPAQAFIRLPVSAPYLLKGAEGKAQAVAQISYGRRQC